MQSQDEMWEGYFASDVSSLNSLATVVNPDFSDEHYFDASWPVYEGSRLPQKGDPCLVAIPHGGNPWVVAWRQKVATNALDGIGE